MSEPKKSRKPNFELGPRTFFIEPRNPKSAKKSMKIPTFFK